VKPEGVHALKWIREADGRTEEVVGKVEVPSSHGEGIDRIPHEGARIHEEGSMSAGCWQEQER